MDNQYVVAFVFWPIVVLLCAGLNMLITWTFSWSELIFDYFIGLVSGWLLFTGTQPHPHPATSFFFVFSHGLFGFLWWLGGSFRAQFPKPENFFWTLAWIRIAATFWCAALDHFAVKLGAVVSPAPFFFSLLIAPVKFSFAWFTNVVGIVIWFFGLCWTLINKLSDKVKNADKTKDVGKQKGRTGFAGGVLFTEFGPSESDGKATTFGIAVIAWCGNTPFKHELYHTRQYIYMSDWLMPFWCVGLLWGYLSASAFDTVSRHLIVGAHDTREIGNPIEIAAYHISDLPALHAC